MDKYGKFIAPDTLRFERLLPGPIERVWEYLTDSEKRGKWLASGHMELFPGGKVELNFYHDNLSPDPDPIPDKYKDMKDGAKSKGVVTHCDPPKLLTFTWGNEGEVTFELIEKDDKVLLVLTHEKLGEDKETLLDVGAGWHTHLDILCDRLEGVNPKGFWAVHTSLEKEYEERFG